MKFINIANFLSDHFPLVLLLSFVVGLVIPGLEKIPTHVITILVALQIFCSCFKVELADVRGTRVLPVLAFYIGRFVFLPGLAYIFMTKIGFSCTYSAAIFLLLVLPAGVSAPAITGILRGNVSLSLLLVVFSSLLSPFVIPGLFELFVGKSLNIDVQEMFMTMGLLIFLPVLSQLPFRKSNQISCWMKTYHAALVVPMMAGTFVLAIAKQREFLLENWSALLNAFVVSMLIFLFVYGIVWIGFCRTERKYQVAFVLSSGLNNISLGIVLSSLYFDADVAIFMVVANVSWVIAIMPIRWWLTVRSPKSKSMNPMGGKVT